MNIFYLDPDPVKAAEYQCDRHIVKMTLETAQLLCAVFPCGEAPYKPTHMQHPCSLWLRASRGNWNWLVAHGRALGAEYTFRYGKHHKSSDVIDWCAAHDGELTFPEVTLLEPAQCMPVQYQSNDPVEAYRTYYREAKRPFATWKPPAKTPDWWR